jgi:hypothetical protein
MEKQLERKRKSKGSLSVMDEFTGEAGVISFQPTISTEDQTRIDHKTRFADVPSSVRVQTYNSIDLSLKSNLGQTSDNPKTEPRTIIGQLSDNYRTNLSQYSHAIIETSDNPKTEPRTNLRTNLGQLSDKPRTISAFQALSGLQKNILILIYDLCRIKGERTTAPLSIEHLFLKLASTRLSVQKSIQRLEQKHLLIRKEFRSGRGGWTVYELPEGVWNEILQNETSDKLRTNLGQLSDKPRTEPRTEPRTPPPCSSSNLNINKTTTTPPELDPDLWLSVPKNLEGRVSIKQLRDFVRQGLITPEDLQSSLDGFSYDLAKNAIKSKLGNPVAIFIGAVKSGGYISQSYLSELKASMADVERSRIEMQQIQTSLASEQIQKDFESFRSQFPEQAEKLKPLNTYLSNFEPGSVGYKLWLEEYKKHQNMHHNEAARELAL